MATIPPVFLKHKNIPNAMETKPTSLEICLAAERSAGQGSVVGAQDIRGLWRIYPATKEARSTLLVKGIVLRDCALQVCNTNPFILRDGSGEEKPSTKVWVDDVPLSVANSEVEHSLSKVGCELRSQIKTERARDADGKLTRFLTGRRFVFITTPSRPLDRFLKVSLFVAKIFHKEQKSVTNPGCSRCFDTSHHVSECTNDIVCRDCRQPGHKRNDPACRYIEEDSQSQKSSAALADETTADDTPTSSQPSLQTHVSRRDADTERRRSSKVASKPTRAAKDDERSSNSKNRPLRRQTTLLEMERPRSRSGTPKRQRSGEQPAPGDETGKHARRDDDGCQSWSDGTVDDEDTRTDN